MISHEEHFRNREANADSKEQTEEKRIVVEKSSLMLLTSAQKISETIYLCEYESNGER